MAFSRQGSRSVSALFDLGKFIGKTEWFSLEGLACHLIKGELMSRIYASLENLLTQLISEPGDFRF